MRLLGVFQRRREDEERKREMEDYLARETEENVAQGMTPEEARRVAHVKLGSTRRIREEIREMNGIAFLETLWQDVKYAARMLRKSPGFTAVAVLTLALGIGANTAIFSITNAVILNGLPYPNASRLVMLDESLPKMEETAVSWPDFLDWRAQNRSFDMIAAYNPDSATLLGTGDPVVIPTEFVSSDYFSLLGARPYLGRLLDANDDKSGGVSAAVVSYSLWRNRLKGDPGIVGKSIDLDGYATPVVGVLPPDFHDFAGHPDVYAPTGWMSKVAGYADRANHPGIRVLARLRSGLSIAAARADMNSIMGRLGEQYPKSDRGERATITPLFTAYLGSTSRELIFLFAAVGFVLLLACANVANLSLARNSSRCREISVRAALGASRSRLIRQLLSESLLLATSGAGIGLLIASEGERLFHQLVPATLQGAQENVVDPAVLLFTLAMALLTTILFGLAPSWQTTRVDLGPTLNESSRNVSSPGSQRRLRSALLSFEIAVALVVVISSGLMLRSLAATLSVNPGFDAEHVLALGVQIPGSEVSKAYDLSFVAQVLGGIEHLPGVRFAGAAMNPPLAGLHWTSPYLVEGQPAPPSTEWPNTALNMVTPDYFRAIGARLLAGRYFSKSDNDSSVAVAIVNQAMARRISPNGSAVGKQLRVRYAAHPLVQIVGIIPDLKQFGLTSRDWPEVFVPFAQMPVSFMTLMIRTAGDPSSIERAATLAIHNVDRNQPVSNVVPLASYISNSAQQQRFLAWLLGVFGALAIVLSAVGVYGVVAHGTSQRMHEIGIRVALGAQRGDVMRLVLTQGAKLVLIGLLLGIGGALALTRLMASLLFGVSASDPLTFVGVAILLALVALAACYVPARRAMRVDPMVALRYE